MVVLRWRTVWNSVSVHPTTSAARVNVVLMATTGPSRVRTSAPVYLVSVTTVLTYVTPTQEPVSSVHHTLLTYLLTLFYLLDSGACLVSLYLLTYYHSLLVSLLTYCSFSVVMLLID